MRSLVRYTYFPELQIVFDTVLTISPVTEQGFSLSAMNSYLIDSKLDYVTHDEFWYVMRTLLSRYNNKYLQKMKKKMNENKSGGG